MAGSEARACRSRAESRRPSQRLLQHEPWVGAGSCSSPRLGAASPPSGLWIRNACLRPWQSRYGCIGVLLASSEGGAMHDLGCRGWVFGLILGLFCDGCVVGPCAGAILAPAGRGGDGGAALAGFRAGALRSSGGWLPRPLRGLWQGRRRSRSGLRADGRRLAGARMAPTAVPAYRVRTRGRRRRRPARACVGGEGGRPHCLGLDRGSAQLGADDPETAGSPARTGLGGCTPSAADRAGVGSCRGSSRGADADAYRAGGGQEFWNVRMLRPRSRRTSLDTSTTIDDAIRFRSTGRRR